MLEGTLSRSQQSATGLYILIRSTLSHTISRRRILILSFHLSLVSQMVSSLEVFWYISYLPHACYKSHESYHNLCSTRDIVAGAEQKLWTKFRCKFLYFLSVCSISPYVIIPPSRMTLNNLCSWSELINRLQHTVLRFILVKSCEIHSRSDCGTEVTDRSFVSSLPADRNTCCSSVLRNSGGILNCAQGGSLNQWCSREHLISLLTLKCDTQTVFYISGFHDGIDLLGCNDL